MKPHQTGKGQPATGSRSRPPSLGPLPPVVAVLEDAGSSSTQPSAVDLEALGTLGSTIYWGVFEHSHTPTQSPSLLDTPTAAMIPPTPFKLDSLSYGARFKVAYRGPVLAAPRTTGPPWGGVHPTSLDGTAEELVGRLSHPSSSSISLGRVPHPDETFLGLVQLEPLSCTATPVVLPTPTPNEKETASSSTRRAQRTTVPPTTPLPTAPLPQHIAYRFPGGFMGNTDGHWPPLLHPTTPTTNNDNVPEKGTISNASPSSSPLAYFQGPSPHHALFLPEKDVLGLIADLQSYHIKRGEEIAAAARTTSPPPPTQQSNRAPSNTARSIPKKASNPPPRSGVSSAGAPSRLAPLGNNKGKSSSSISAATPPSVSIIPNRWPLDLPPPSYGELPSKALAAFHRAKMARDSMPASVKEVVGGDGADVVASTEAGKSSNDQETDDDGNSRPSSTARRTKFRFEVDADSSRPGSGSATVVVTKPKPVMVDAGTNTTPVLIQQLLDTDMDDDMNTNGLTTTNATTRGVMSISNTTAATSSDAHAMAQCRAAIDHHLAALKSHLKYFLPQDDTTNNSSSGVASVTARYHSMQLSHLTEVVDRAGALRATLLQQQQSNTTTNNNTSSVVVVDPVEYFGQTMSRLASQGYNRAKVVGEVDVPCGVLRDEVLHAMGSQLEVFLQDLNASLLLGQDNTTNSEDGVVVGVRGEEGGGSIAPPAGRLGGRHGIHSNNNHRITTNIDGSSDEDDDADGDGIIPSQSPSPQREGHHHHQQNTTTAVSRYLPHRSTNRVNRLSRYVSAADDVVREALQELLSTLHTPYIPTTHEDDVDEWQEAITALCGQHQVPPNIDTCSLLFEQQHSADEGLDGLDENDIGSNSPSRLLKVLLLDPLLRYALLPLQDKYVDPTTTTTTISSTNRPMITDTDASAIATDATLQHSPPSTTSKSVSDADHPYGLDVQACAFAPSFLWDTSSTNDEGNAVRMSIASNHKYLDLCDAYAERVAAVRDVLGRRMPAFTEAVSAAKQEGDVDAALEALCCGMEEAYSSLSTCRDAIHTIKPSIIHTFVDTPRQALRTLFEQFFSRKSPSGTTTASTRSGGGGGGSDATFIEHTQSRPIEAANGLLRDRLGTLMREYSDKEAQFTKDRYHNADRLRVALDQYGVLQSEGDRVVVEVGRLLDKLSDIQSGRDAIANQVSELVEEKEELHRQFHVDVVVNAACRRGVDDLRTTVEGIRDLCGPRIVAWLRSLKEREEGALSEINVSVHDRLVELSTMYSDSVAQYSKFAGDFIFAKSKVLERLRVRVDELTKKQFWCDFKSSAADGAASPSHKGQHGGEPPDTTPPLSASEVKELAMLSESVIAVESTIKTVSNDLKAVATTFQSHTGN